MSLPSFLFLVSNTPWVYALSEALGRKYATHTTRFYDWLNYRRLRPSWPDSKVSQLRRTVNVLPPGYVGKLALIFNPYIQWLVFQWYKQLCNKSASEPWVIIPYPFSAPWVQYLPSKRLVYYNLDEYIYYQLENQEKILAQESELVKRSALILCIAQFQVETLRQRYPCSSASIHYFPLGVMEEYINPSPTNIPKQMTVGYVGNLIDRVDWQLVAHVALACPEVSFVFVGGLDDFIGDTLNQSWQQERDAALSLSNVSHIGKVPQQDVGKYYWSFAINWIPYNLNHPFNLASCPTKIMDGIASCRPVISSDIPECRLYPRWISIFHSAEEAAKLVRLHLSLLDSPATCQKAEEQHAFVTQQTWEHRAESLILLLNEIK